MKVTIEITIDVRTADDMKVFAGKALQGSESAAAEHPLTMQFLAKASRAIENAAGYVRAQQPRAGG